MLAHIKGKPLLYLLSFLMIFFAFAIPIRTYFINKTLTEDEQYVETEEIETLVNFRSGKVSFMGADFYEEEGIEYVLSDSDGKDIILLKAEDEKLSIVEGLFVTVSGQMRKTFGGEDYLLVEEIIIDNDSD